MIFMQSVLKIADNSGVKNVRCIKIFKKIKTPGKINNLCICSILKLKKKKIVNIKLKNQLSKGLKKTGIIIRTKQYKKRFDGLMFKFLENSIVLIDSKNKKPLATRILGSIPFEFRTQKTLKLVLISDKII